MPNLANVLKEEIRRLAKKEAKLLLKNALRSAAQHRRDIARLKRQITAAERQIAYLGRQERKQVGTTAAIESGPKIRFSARSVRAQRERLELSAHDYGKLLGVSGQTIYFWAQGKSRPRSAQMQRLVEARQLGKREALAKLEMLSNGQAKGRARKK